MSASADATGDLMSMVQKKTLKSQSLDVESRNRKTQASAMRAHGTSKEGDGETGHAPHLHKRLTVQSVCLACASTLPCRRGGKQGRCRRKNDEKRFRGRRPILMPMTWCPCDALTLLPRVCAVCAPCRVCPARGLGAQQHVSLLPL